MLEKKLEIGFEYFPGTHSFSINKYTVVLEDGKEISNGVHTCSFLPGQVEELIKYLEDPEHPLVSYCNIIWTPDIIAVQEAIDAKNKVQ